MSKPIPFFQSYMRSDYGGILTQYAVWVTVGTVVLSVLGVTSAEFIIDVVENDVRIEQASNDSLIKDDGDYETADIPGLGVQERPVLLPFLRRLVE